MVNRRKSWLIRPAPGTYWQRERPGLARDTSEVRLVDETAWRTAHFVFGRRGHWHALALEKTMSDFDMNRELRLIHEAKDEEQTLERVTTFALGAMPCSSAGVMIATGRHVESVAVTGSIVVSVDDAQRHFDEGPCLSALRECDHFRIDDTATDQRWPQWGPVAAELGVRSVLSTRMAGLQNPAVGSLNLYAEQVDAFGPRDVELAAILAGHAATAYLRSVRASAALRALDSRTSIGQAEGILMERFHVDAETAFAVLRRYSQALNQPLREVARQFVERRTLPSIRHEEDDPPNT
jgi:GAF domain-containing protein